MLRVSLRSVWTLCGASALLLACEDKPASRALSGADAGAPRQGPAVDPNIAAAVRAVAKAAPSQAGVGAAGKQPPPNGVFAAGEADAELAAGAPPKLTVGATGGTPKMVLKGLVLNPDGGRELVATVAVRTGPRAALPTLDILLKVAPEGAKKKKKKSEKDGEGEAAPGEAAVPAGLDLVASATKVELSARQPGRLPPGLDAEVRKLAGSRLSYQLAPAGGLIGMSVEVAKGADEGLDRVVRSLSELLPALHAPLPVEPVGNGGFWMVTTREPFIGLDAVTYRMFRVERIEGTDATLSVTTKRFIAGGQVEFPGLPKHTVDEFRGEGRGEIVVSADRGIVRAQLNDTLLANLAPEEDPARRITIQLEEQASITVAGGP